MDHDIAGDTVSGGTVGAGGSLGSVESLVDSMDDRAWAVRNSILSVEDGYKHAHK